MLPFLQTARRNLVNETDPVLEDDWRPSPVAIRESYGNLQEALSVLDEAKRKIRMQEERIQELEQQALTDELTGLVNRRGFMLALNRELAMAKRDPKAGGVLVMVDLDGFKQINDLWGHCAGDDYLQIAAYTLLGDVRTTDIVARVGGDEFAILLTRIDADTGAARVENLEKSFNSRMTQWNRDPIPLRASFGFAVYGAGDSFEPLMASADFKLYAHKAKRRARITA